MRMRTIRVVVAAGMLAGLGCTVLPLASETPLAVTPVTLSPGEERAIDHVFIVTDASGTMYEQKTFPKAKALSQSFVDALPEKDVAARSETYNAGSVGFGGDARTALALQAFDRAALREAVDQVQVMGRIDGGGGYTPIEDVLGEIGAQLDAKSGRAAIVVFSDGEPDDVVAALDAAIALSSSHADGVCYHAVQVGNAPVGAQFLRTLSEVSSPCGSFRSAGEVSTGVQLASFTKSVMLGVPAMGRTPGVAANACDGMTLHSVGFAFDRAEIRTDAMGFLDQAAAQLKGCPDVKLNVEGHTDSRGPEDYNQSLSERRAASVVNYLVNQGIDAKRLMPSGVGESQPLDESGTAAGFQRNRRVEMEAR